MESHTTLPDGTPVRIRPLQPDDREEFIAVFNGLSAQTRYTRFLTPVDHLSDAEVDYFLDIDHRDHEALVATEEEGGERVGLGRYVRDPDREETAEVALTVMDAWQHRGVGTILLTALTELARERGFTAFTAEMLTSNVPMRALFAHLGDVTYTPLGSGAVQADASLDP